MNKSKTKFRRENVLRYLALEEDSPFADVVIDGNKIKAAIDLNELDVKANSIVLRPYNDQVLIMNAKGRLIYHGVFLFRVRIDVGQLRYYYNNDVLYIEAPIVRSKPRDLGALLELRD
ncbi:MAG: hypothetical protein JZD41_09250 [Thermoproteus sp.]|nr:hypothetical protein [Thermoproteus sp.]